MNFLLGLNVIITIIIVDENNARVKLSRILFEFNFPRPQLTIDPIRHKYNLDIFTLVVFKIISIRSKLMFWFYNDLFSLASHFL